MVILWEHFWTKMKKIGLLEWVLHCVKIDKFKKMTLYFFRICVTVRCVIFGVHPPVIFVCKQNRMFLLNILYANFVLTAQSGHNTLFNKIE